jgi:hypothetical protein
MGNSLEQYRAAIGTFYTQCHCVVIMSTIKILKFSNMMEVMLFICAVLKTKVLGFVVLCTWNYFLCATDYIFSLPELKVWSPFVRRPSVCPSVCKLLHFQLIQNHCVNFNQTWYKSSLRGGDSSFFFFSNEWDCLSPRGDNSKTIKICWIFFKSSPPEPASQIQSNLLHIILG